MYTVILFCVYINFIIPFVYSQVGDQCNLPVYGKKGVCKISSDCPSAIVQSKVGISPVICGYQNNVPVVCCKGKAAIAATPPSISFSPGNVKPYIPNHGMRISEQKCREYTRSVRAEVVSIPLAAHSSSVRYETANCSNEGIPTIYGGEKARLGEFPHMALLGYDNPPKWLCGGSLISEQFVLTASHCLTAPQFGQVRIARLGELNVKESDPISEDFDIIEVFKHPEYKRPKVYNDIALLKLSRKVQFSSYKRPACLWSKYEFGTNSTIATGWGTTEHDPLSVSDHLLKAGLDIIPSSDCHEMYMDYFDRKLDAITRNLICARNTTHLGDSCSGDSGGPIQITKPDNACIFYVIGVTAAGRHCGGNFPGLYTRVSEYVDWIEGIVWK